MQFVNTGKSDSGIAEQMNTTDCDAYGDVSFAEMFGLDEFLKQEPDTGIKIESFPTSCEIKPNCPSVPETDPTTKFPIPPILKMQEHSRKRQQPPATPKPSKRTKVPLPPALSNSAKSTSDPDIDVQYSYLCSYCSFISAHKSSVRRHIGTTHGSDPNVSVDNIGEKELFLCKHCKFNSNHRSSVKRHVGTQHQDKSSQCASNNERPSVSNSPKPLTPPRDVKKPVPVKELKPVKQEPLLTCTADTPLPIMGRGYQNIQASVKPDPNTNLGFHSPPVISTQSHSVVGYPSPSCLSQPQLKCEPQVHQAPQACVSSAQQYSSQVYPNQMAHTANSMYAMPTQQPYPPQIHNAYMYAHPQYPQYTSSSSNQVIR